jgi:hypothetical protein
MMNILRIIAQNLVQFMGAGFSFMALGCSLVGTPLLPYHIPQSFLHWLVQFLVCVAAILIGLATTLRFRVAAICVAACLLLLCIDEAYGMAHGFSLPQPPHYSNNEIAVQVLVGFIPAILIAFAWPRLRSMRRTI